MSVDETAPAPTGPASGARLSGLSMARLAWLQANHRRVSAACLGLCLVIAIVLPALLPLMDGFALERSVADSVARDGGLTVEQKVTDVYQFTSFQREVTARVDGSMGGVLLPLSAYASTARLYPTSLNTDPVPSSLAGRAFQARYVDGLAGHIELQAGQLPPDGLGGGETAVTIPQSGADLAGLNLFDRFCLSFNPTAATEPRWCARIVGLWRPLDLRDPFWAGRTPQLEFALGRYDFFQLAKREPAHPSTAGLSYWADPAAVDGARAEQVAQRIRGVVGELQAPQRQVTTRLDASLLRVADQHRAMAPSVHVFTAALALLGLLVVGLVAVRFLGEQSRLLAILRARGWRPTRTWLQAFVGLGTPAVYGLPVALGACVLILALVGTADSNAGILALGSAQGRAAIYVGCLLAGVVILLLAGIAGWAVRRDLRPSLDEPFRRSWPGGRRLTVVAACALLGAAALLTTRLPVPREATNGTLGLAFGVVPALGVVAVAFAAAQLPGGRAGLSSGRSPERLLARWQLGRAPEQHAAMAVALTLASATSAFAALAVVWERMGAAAPIDPALRAGQEATFATGFLGIVALVLVAVALHYRSVTRRRLREYAGLFGHGLTPAQLRRSLAGEQATTSARSLLAGSALGILLAVLSGFFAPDPTTIATGLLCLGAVVVGLLVGALVVGRLTRRLPERPDPLGGGLEA